MKLKIMNYNILHGFHEVSPPFAFSKKRLDSAIKIVKKENPDILVLTEACYGGNNPFGINLDYKELFNFPYGFFGKWGNYEWGNFVLSKFPLKGKLIPLGERTAIKSEIKIKNKKIFLDVIHPSPESSEEEKMNNVQEVINKKKNPYFLVGDFNSLSDEDEYNKEKLIKGYSQFDKFPVQTVSRILERKFVPHLKSQGLLDTFNEKSRKTTVPTKIYGDSNDSSSRMDFIFSSRDVKTIKTKVVKNKLTDYASDHYPLIGIYEV